MVNSVMGFGRVHAPIGHELAWHWDRPGQRVKTGVL
jgi:hypothetical protein